MALTSINLTPRIGAEIRADRATLLGGAHGAEIREILEKRGVVIFRAIDLNDEEQLAFSATIGDVIPQGEKGVFKVTMDKKENKLADYLLGAVHWHIDGSMDNAPTRASLLSARRLAPTGGQTEFANTYAAWEELPAEKKAQVEGLKAFHTMEGTQRGVVADPSDETRADWGRYPAKLHPLVWTHRSGRKSLLLGSSTDWIDGMDKEAGRALIAELQAWATQARFVYRHEWQVGDLVIWDNCGSLHRVEPYPADSGRRMHRVTLVGEEPIA